MMKNLILVGFLLIGNFIQAQSNEQSLQSYSKFDFVPGDKVIFFDDFSQDNIGDFPALWYSNGSGEVVTLNNYPGKWLIIKAQGFYYPEKSLATTENFTIEFDVIPVTVNEDDRFNFQFNIVADDIKNRERDSDYPGKAGFKAGITNSGISFYAFANSTNTGSGNKEMELDPHKKIHISCWIQKTRIRIYVDENKVADAPRIMPEGFKYNVMMFYMTNAYNASCAITNFKVAAGLPDTRNKLLTEGKLISYGIYFDVNKDVVKPESYGTLKDIAQVLKDNPAVRIKITGHTDADGEDGSNLDLSKKRAVAVKHELVNTFGIDASRIETDGKGEAQPVAPNDSPSNKALNRRVEFIKL
ncbi:MAG: OmpA family protein [Lacibacter sp.]